MADFYTGIDFDAVTGNYFKQYYGVNYTHLLKFLYY